jgi:hypothetical protein
LEYLLDKVGSENGISKLQLAFDCPDYAETEYSEGYSVYDAGMELLHYLNSFTPGFMLYDDYNSLLSTSQVSVGYEANDKGHFRREEFRYSATIRSLQVAITRLPVLELQLLLYILDFLAASLLEESRKSDDSWHDDIPAQPAQQTSEQDADRE